MPYNKQYPSIKQRVSIYIVSIHFVCYICTNVLAFARFRPGSIMVRLYLVYQSAPPSQPLAKLISAVKNNNFGGFSVNDIKQEGGGK